MLLRHYAVRLSLEAQLDGPEQALHCFDCVLDGTVRAGVVGWRPFARRLRNALNAKAAQRLVAKGHDGWLVVGLDQKLGIPEPFDVFNNPSNCVAVGIQALLRHHMGKDCAALRVFGH